MPSLNSSTQVTAVNANAASGSTAVTVPAGANLVVAMCAGYSDNQFASLSLNGSGFTLLQNPINSEIPQAYVAVLENPSTGNLAWSWDNGSWPEGGNIKLIWVDDANIGDSVRDSDANGNDYSNNPGPLTLDSTTEDLAIGFAMSYDGTTPNVELAGQTLVQAYSSTNDQVEAVFTVDSPGASTTNFAMSNIDWSAIAAITLKAAAGGAINIDATAVALTIAEQGANVNRAKVIGAGVVVLTVAEQAAVIKVSRNLTATLVELSIAEQGAILTKDFAAAATNVAMTIAEQAASVVLDQGIQATNVALTITEQPANVNRALTIAGAAVALTIAEQAASTTLSKNVAAGLTALDINTLTAAIAAQVETEVPVSVVRKLVLNILYGPKLDIWKDVR